MAIWGNTNAQGTGGLGSTWIWVYGGLSPAGNNQMDAIQLLGPDPGETMRVAVYAGGVSGDPAGAVLLEDFGVITIVDTNFLTIPSSDFPVLPDAGYLWVVAKSEVGGLYRQNSLPAGDFTESYRIFNSVDESVAFEPVLTGSYSAQTIAAVITIVHSEAAPTVPTLTGPDSTTDGTNTVETGTLLDTVTIQSLISGSYEVIQSIGVQTPTTLEYIANSGVNDCAPGTPAPGVPLEATITAPGITPYIVQQKVDDGVNSPTTRNITLNAPATHDVIQAMIASANTIDDRSIFGTSWIGVEDNMQATPPKQVDGVNFTWNADGTFTTDQDKTVNVRVPYFAPSTGQYGCINFTIQGSSIKPTGVNKNKRQSLTYQFYYNKNWRDKFQGGGE